MLGTPFVGGRNRVFTGPPAALRALFAATHVKHFISLPAGRMLRAAAGALAK
jgi:hypothetical protein